MNVANQLSDADIRKARAANPKLRERDLATNLGISEARYLAAWIGNGVRRLRADPDTILSNLAGVGEVMALTRNAYAVHEKTGRYEGYRPGDHVAMVLGPVIDLRVFLSHWVHAFAIDKTVGDTTLHSIQVFDAHGDAVHKVFTRQTTDIDAWQALVAELGRGAPTDPIAVEPRRKIDNSRPGGADAAAFRQQWAALSDTHQIAGLLKRYGISKAEMVRVLEPEFAWQLQPDAVDVLLHIVANENVPIMVFVRNPGCLQVHSGPVKTLKQVGPWLNVMDPDFHLHLRTDKIASVWAIRKPTDAGDVLSVEAFAANGMPVILINGQPNQTARSGDDWRLIVEGLPRND